MKYHDKSSAATIILADRRKYGPHGSLLLRWAILVLRRDLYADYARACDDERFAEAELIALEAAR